jgi:two-component system, LytTR family, sensor histidine kinase AlgZ
MGTAGMMLACRSDMRGIIRQKAEFPVLPDLRNLGTILRILLAVNGAALVVAFAREQRWDALITQWIALTSFVEPNLLLELVILAMIAPWLSGMRYRDGVAVIALVTVAVTVAVHALVDRIMPGLAGSLARQIVIALGMALALLFYFNLRVKALSPAIAEARLQALQARIRPHFLFNSLNAVLSLVRSDPRRAETALEDLADLFRVLMRDNRELTLLEDEVLLCQRYLDLEKLRLGDRLVVDWNVKSMPGDALIPPLVLQPLVENAVYHGIEPSSEPGTVSINLFLSRGEVHAILKNPVLGNGRRHQSGNRMALENIRERLALHFDAEASLESRVTKESYEVHIRMPYRTQRPEPAVEPHADAQRHGGLPRNNVHRSRAMAHPRGLPGVPQTEVASG